MPQNSQQALNCQRMFSLPMQRAGGKMYSYAMFLLRAAVVHHEVSHYSITRSLVERCIVR